MQQVIDEGCCSLGLLKDSRYRFDRLVLTELTKKSQKKRNYVGRGPVKQVASPVFMYTIRRLAKKVDNRRLLVGGVLSLSPVLKDIGRLYCHVSADVIVCWGLVARQH